MTAVWSINYEEHFCSQQKTSVTPCLNAGPASVTLAQYWDSVWPTSSQRSSPNSDVTNKTWQPTKPQIQNTMWTATRDYNRTLKCTKQSWIFILWDKSGIINVVYKLIYKLVTSAQKLWDLSNILLRRSSSAWSYSVNQPCDFPIIAKK